MKKLLASLAALTALTAAADAADLPRRAAPPPVFVPVPVFTWTGFYVGFNAGYGFNVAEDYADPTVVVTNDARIVGGAPGAAAAFAFNNSSRGDGFVGGGQVGYNYQFTPGSGVVVGVEADAQYADLGGRFGKASTCPPITAAVACAGTATAVAQPGVTVFNPTGTAGIDFFGTARGRLGYAFDRVLFYGTGGFAYASVGGGKAVDVDDFATGWTAGGGVEYALPTDSFLNFFRSSAVTLKVEALYVNLDSGNARGGYANANGTIVTATPLPQATAASTSVQLNNFGQRDIEFAVIRGGINYKFGSY